MTKAMYREVEDLAVAAIKAGLAPGLVGTEQSRTALLSGIQALELLHAIRYPSRDSLDGSDALG